MTTNKDFDPINHLQNGGRSYWEKMPDVYMWLSDGKVVSSVSNHGYNKPWPEVFGSLLRYPGQWHPVRETFGFAEAARRIEAGETVCCPSCHISQWDKIGWLGKAHGKPDPTSMANATDYYVV